MLSYPNPPEDLNLRPYFAPNSEEYKLLKELVVSEIAFILNSMYCTHHHSIEARSEGAKLRHSNCSNILQRIDLIGTSQEETIQKFIIAATNAGHVDAHSNMRAVYFPKFLPHSEKLKQTRELKKVKMPGDNPRPEESKIQIPNLSTSAVSLPRPTATLSSTLIPEPVGTVHEIPIRRSVGSGSERRRQDSQDQIVILIDALTQKIERQITAVRQSQAQAVNLMSALFTQMQDLMEAMHLSESQSQAARGSRGARRGGGARRGVRGRGQNRGRGRSRSQRTPTRDLEEDYVYGDLLIDENEEDYEQDQD